jgi:endonuclease/exonuclease/phosphatase (EEP) superfamily protein YafD
MKPTENTAPKKLSFVAKWVIGLSCLNLVFLSAVNYVLYFVSERWWIGTVLTFSPRIVFLLPALVLLLASLLWHRTSLVVNLIAAGIVLVPLMELSLPLDLWLNGSPRTDGNLVLRVVSCNVQSFQPAISKVLDEIAALKPDIVALQEAFGDDEQIDRFFHDWHTVRQGQYRIFSRDPVALLAPCEVTQFGGRLAGMIVRIDCEGSPVVLANIHQMTVRSQLEELRSDSFFSGKGKKELEQATVERNLESAAIRDSIDRAQKSNSLIVCGDFNTPTSSNLFRRHWGDLKSSFDSAGLGYGYTSPCKGSQYWPDNTPWARIDHILCSPEWSVKACEVGESDGSDHRLIVATLVLKPKAKQ